MPEPPTVSAPPAPAPVQVSVPSPLATAAPAPPEPAPVIPPRFDAAYLDNPAPAYPSLARRMGEQGKVLLRVRVNAGGQAEDVQVKTGSGHPRLDEAALSTVKQWRFVPARQGDQGAGAHRVQAGRLVNCSTQIGSECSDLAQPQRRELQSTSE